MFLEQVVRAWPPPGWAKIKHTSIWTWASYLLYRWTKAIKSLHSAHLIGSVAGGEGPWGHTSLAGRPLLAQLSPALCGVAWERYMHTCHWHSLIRSSHPPHPTQTPPERHSSDSPVPHRRPSRINRSSVSRGSLSLNLRKVSLMYSYWELVLNVLQMTDRLHESSCYVSAAWWVLIAHHEQLWSNVSQSYLLDCFLIIYFSSFCCPKTNKKKHPGDIFIS